MFLKKFNKFSHPYLKPRLFALIYVCLGCFFIFGFFYSQNGDTDYSSHIQKWTSQSNFMAFIVAFLYLIKPTFKIFKNNFLLLFAGNCLFLAGVGFWLILFPTVFVGLPDYVINSANHKEMKDVGFLSKFVYIWDHLVMQIAFFAFMMIAFQKSNEKHLVPVRLRTINIILIIWTSIYIIVFVIIFPFTTNYFPVYGIFTNLNPYTQFKLSNGAPLYSWKISVSTIIVFFFASLIISFFNWRISIQFNKIMMVRYLQEID